MLGVVDSKVGLPGSFKLCTTTPNNMQQGVCKWMQHVTSNNVGSMIDVHETNVVPICTGLNVLVLLPCSHLLW